MTAFVTNTATIPPASDRQPVDWQVIDDAIYDWLNDLLALGDRILWENLDEPQPAKYPYLSLFRSPVASEGGLKELRIRSLDSAGAVVTDEVLQTVVENEDMSYEPTAFTVAIQAHVDRDGGRNDPMCNAVALLTKAKASLGLPSILAALSAAGISVVRDEAVLDISLVINSEFISRASLDVIFRTASVMSEKSGFINKVQLVSTDLDVDVTVDSTV